MLIIEDPTETEKCRKKSEDTKGVIRICRTAI